MRAIFFGLLVCAILFGAVVLSPVAAQAQEQSVQKVQTVPPMTGNIGAQIQNAPGGVLVVGIEPHSPAWRNLDVGDIIVNVDGRAISSVGDFEAAKRASDGVIRCYIFDVRTKTYMYRNIPLR